MRLFHMSSAIVALLTPGLLVAADPFRVTVDSTITVSVGDTPRFVYRHGDVSFKPYIQEFYSPSGINILQDAPGDHIHHHALMYAISVDEVDFWAEFPDRDQGSQVSRRIEPISRSLPGGVAAAGFSQPLDWIAPDEAKTRLMTERRTITTYEADDLDASLLTWQSEFTAGPDKDFVTLTGSHYFGLGMRLAESMDVVGRFFYASGEPGPIRRGKERLTKSRWVAYVAPAGGKTLTVAVFDHPTNARHPATMFTMPEKFAYISATLNLAEEPLTLEAGKPLMLSYGVALWESEVTPEQIEKLYQRWIGLATSSD